MMRAPRVLGWISGRRSAGRRQRCLLHALLLGVLLAFATRPPTTSAHPLGNFTINLYSRLAMQVDRVDVTYVLDMAEIPTFQEWGGPPPDASQATAYAARKAAELRENLALTVDGQRRDLRIVQQRISFPPGQGGLALTRLELDLTAALLPLRAGAPRSISYADRNYETRIGWHEIVIAPEQGVTIRSADVPATDLSNALRSYPTDMLQSPLNVRTAYAEIALGQTQTTANLSAVPATGRASDRFAALINAEQLGPWVLVLTLLAAFGLGSLHALSPGHGKAIVAAYLVGARGTARHALFLGLTVTATHTLGVFALGIITLYASHFILPERLYPWLSIVSGTIVVLMGITLLRQRWRGIRATARAQHDQAHDHDHDHQHHDHDHAGQPHAHLPPGADGSPVTWRSMLAIGISGGLLPCPSALVVMLSAISLGRVGFGLILIILFSLGLASVLAGIGVMFVYGGHWFAQLNQRHRPVLLERGLRFVPVLSAIIVTSGGVLITAKALAQAGWLR